MKRLFLPVCLLIGHDNELPDEPGRSLIVCRRCGRDTTKGYWYQKLPYQISFAFLWAANKTYEIGGDVPTYQPHYRGIDGKRLTSLGTKHSCDAYSYEHLQSLMKQEGTGYTLGQLFDESGWIEITDDNAEEMIGLINADFEKRSNELEREETMRIVRGNKSDVE